MLSKSMGLALVLATGLWLVGCSDGPARHAGGCGGGGCGSGNPAPPPPGPGPAAQAAAYVCPMHPQVTSNAPGNCSICGMALSPRR